ncbi:MAG: hypothetical protein JNL67_12230 [Planctomycetaceae bacterium]|nr:hypothetical protein [Planctomycetaceae bacterium]
MRELSPLIAVGLSLLILGWVIFRSILRRRLQGQQPTPLKQVADVKAELDRIESRGSRALRDAPAEVLRWQAEIFELTRDIHGQLDTKIALLAATIRLADQRLAELKNQLAKLEQLAERVPNSNDNPETLEP